MDFKLRKICTA